LGNRRSPTANRRDAILSNDDLDVPNWSSAVSIDQRPSVDHEDVLRRSLAGQLTRRRPTEERAGQQ
jgi:hypothetical protein